MSSEMRKISEAWKLSAKQFSELGSDIGMIEAAVYSNCAKEIDALLARTEAGADGAAMLVRDVCEMAPADPDAPDTVCIRVSDLTRIAEQYTHPQDASGDAEALQDLMTTVRAVAFSGDYGISDEAIAALSDALDDAMQAKEAK